MHGAESGIPGLVYGGLIASIIDCHSTGTAAATKWRPEGREAELKLVPSLPRGSIS